MATGKLIAVRWNDDEIRDLEKAAKYLKVKDMYGGYSKAIKLSVKLLNENFDLLLDDFTSRYHTMQKQIIKDMLRSGQI